MSPLLSLKQSPYVWFEKECLIVQPFRMKFKEKIIEFSIVILLSKNVHLIVFLSMIFFKIMFLKSLKLEKHQ